MTPEEVKALRLKLGVTQSQLARALGVSEQTIYNWERGLATPTRYDAVVLLRMAELADTPEGRERIREAVEQAQYMRPAPAEKPKPGISAGEAFAIGALGFGLGALLGALFAAAAVEGARKKRSSNGEAEQPPDEGKEVG